jgi:pilus assembly protein CpaB
MATRSALQLLATSRRTLAILASLVCALLAAWLAHRQFAREQVQATAAFERTNVNLLVASRDLRAGERITVRTVAVRPFPAAFVPAQALRPRQFGVVEGQTLAYPLRSGQPLAADMLKRRRSAVGGISSLLEPGQVAMSFAVNEVEGLSGLLRPHDRVDLLLTLQVPSGSSTYPLLRDAEVLAVGSRVSVSGNESGLAYGAITLAVPRSQEQLLTLARGHGGISVILRSASAPQVSNQGPANARWLLQQLTGAVTTVRSSVPPAPRSIPILYGGNSAGSSMASGPAPRLDLPQGLIAQSQVERNAFGLAGVPRQNQAGRIQ